MHLVLDWDGTVTEVDTLHMLLERFGDVAVYHATELELGRTLTLREVIAVEMRTVTAPLDEVVGWLCEHVRIRPGFAELVAAHDPLIVSAGFHELIEPVLRRDGLDARVVAHHIHPSPSGWRTEFASQEVCEVCGEACKRAAVDGIGPFAYAGDGVSDRCVALAASRVFARSGLTSWLDERGVAYEPFDDFFDVMRALGAGRGS
jgi:2-hydroxy-3-keto-5-methylthiopentenyl-1-phosphate phosphatase